MNKNQSTRVKNPFWMELPSTPGENAFHSSVVYKDYIITIGGEAEESPYAEVGVLNMQTYEWENVRYIGEEKIPQRVGQSVLMSNGNTLIMFGRNDLKENETSNVILITVNDRPDFSFEVNKTDTIGADFPFSWGTACIHQGKLYIFGGRDKTVRISNKVWRLDLGQRAFQNGVLFNQQMYIFGGFDQNEKHLNDLYVLNLDSMVWEQVIYSGTAPSPRESPSMIENSGKIFLFGGGNGDQFFCDLFEFEISSRQWNVIHTVNALSPRSNASLVWYKDSLIIWGGYHGEDEDYFSDIEQIKLIDIQNESKEELEYKSEMKDMLLNPQYSDICFQVQNQEFPAHKGILSARCKYLKNMFESSSYISLSNWPTLGGMKESHTDKIIISDVEQLSFKVLLEFLYTNSAELTDKIALDLLKLTDKWSLLNLKNKCEAFLAKSLSMDNFKDYVVVTKETDFVFAY